MISGLNFIYLHLRLIKCKTIKIKYDVINVPNNKKDKSFKKTDLKIYFINNLSIFYSN